VYDDCWWVDRRAINGSDLESASRLADSVRKYGNRPSAADRRVDYDAGLVPAGRSAEDTWPIRNRSALFLSTVPSPATRPGSSMPNIRRAHLRFGLLTSRTRGHSSDDEVPPPWWMAGWQRRLRIDFIRPSSRTQRNGNRVRLVVLAGEIRRPDRCTPRDRKEPQPIAWDMRSHSYDSAGVRADRNRDHRAVVHPRTAIRGLPGTWETRGAGPNRGALSRSARNRPNSPKR